ncbi:MAG TPA: hypothetical protein VI758_00295 [Bacteroidota bacterium]
MNLLGTIASIYVPAFIKKRELINLFAMTGSAFGSEVPALAELSFNECLTEYASYTKMVVEHSVDRLHNLGGSRQQLCRGAFELGSRLRKRFGVESVKDVMRACRILYKCIGIDFTGTPQGDITIHSCFFSRFYSDQVCGIISCIDKGLVAGLSGGGRLTFTQRITEGFGACKANYVPQEDLRENSHRGGYGSWWCNCC